MQWRLWTVYISWFSPLKSIGVLSKPVGDCGPGLGCNKVTYLKRIDAYLYKNTRYGRDCAIFAGMGLFGRLPGNTVETAIFVYPIS
jgi:hypothetical protein